MRFWNVVRRVACRFGVHYWWHSQVIKDGKEYNICMSCGKLAEDK